MAKADETKAEVVKSLPKRYIAKHEIVRAIPSKNKGVTEFERIQPGDRFAATKEELDDLPKESYAVYKADPKKSAADGEVEVDDDLQKEIDAQNATNANGDNKPKVDDV